jgi:folate-dependent phosphoribosylglycinamide formyltransferase PurN
MGDGVRGYRVAIVCSRRAPGLREFLDLGSPQTIATVLTSDPECSERERLANAGVPLLVHDLAAFYRERGRPRTDLAVRSEYDRATVKQLAPLRPDLIVLCGCLHILTEPVLAAYPERVVNIHDSDLPRYPGLHAVRDAVLAGERETRSTVHLATAAVDRGPALLRSWAFPTHPMIDQARAWGATDVLHAYAYAHREWMMRAAWGYLLAEAVTLFARGEVAVREGRAWIGGTPGPLEVAPVRQLERPSTRGSAPAPQRTRERAS